MTLQKIDCIPEQFKFEQVKSYPVIVNFQGEAVTSDAGLTLIAKLDRKIKITLRLAQCFKDYREQKKVEHSVSSLIAQKIYGLIHLAATAFVKNSVWYSSLNYKTLYSWSRNRRVVAKVEYSNQGVDTRFVVTSLSIKKIPPGKLYTEKYCPRGNMENCLKEQKLELKSDRTSTHTFAGNQLRLWFSSVAYILMNALREQCLAKTELQNATVGTIQTKLLKLGATITVNSRKILISISSYCP